MRATAFFSAVNSLFFLVPAIVWSLLPGTAMAGLHSGVVETVSPASRTFTIRVVSTDKLLKFELAPSAKVTVRGKPGQIGDLASGQTVSVTTSGSSMTATRVAVREATAATAKPAAAGSAQAAPRMTGKRTDSSATDNGATKSRPGDWPQFRGPNRDNLSQEQGLLATWPANGPELVYTTDGLGEGYSSVALVGDSLYTLGTRGGDEMLFALNRENGEQRWATRLGRVFQDGGQGNGPRGTPTVDGEFVYGLGGNGDLVCLKTADGSVVWRLNILEAFQGNNIVWGISESVLIDGDKLICTPGGRAATMAALDKRTGKPLWTAKVPGAPQAGYASAIAIDVGNVRQYVNFVHSGVVGVRAADGEPLWGQSASANGTANCSTPLHADNLVFTASGYGTGGALFRLASRGTSTGSEVVYTTRQMKNHHGGMVLLDGHLYGFDENVLTCLDLQTGNPVWQNRSVGKGSLTYADGRLYLRSEDGPLALAAASPAGYQEFGRFEQPQRSGRRAWAHPVVAGGQLYIRDQDKLLVYNVRK